MCIRDRKFYARSGEVKWAILATDVNVAALRFIQKALGDCMIAGKKPVNNDFKLVDEQALKLATARLEPKIMISEAGFSRSEAGMFATRVVIKRWRDQITALETLIRKS